MTSIVLFTKTDMDERKVDVDLNHHEVCSNLNFKKNRIQTLGGSITTHKPRVYKPLHLASATDMNTKKKFAFLSTETVPDYRPMEYNEINNEKNQKTSSNQSTKFHQLQQKFNNVTIQVRTIYARCQVCLGVVLLISKLNILHL